MNHAGPRAFHMSFVRVVLLWNMAIKPSRASSPNLWFLGGAGARICLDSAAKRLNTNKQRVTMIQCILNCILLCQQFLNAHCETNLYGTLSYSIDSFTPTLSNNKPENGTRIISRKEQSLMCVFDCSCAVIDSPPSPPHTPGKNKELRNITSEPTRSITPQTLWNLLVANICIQSATASMSHRASVSWGSVS